MKIKQLLICISLIGLASCNPKPKIQGLWLLAYTQIDGMKPESLSTKTIFDISDKEIQSITFENYGVSASFNGITVDSKPIQLQELEKEFEITIYEDSLTMIPRKNSNQKTVFWRVPEEFKDKPIDKDCFKGSFLLSTPFIEDSIDFVNDSIMLHTGSINEEAVKWQLFRYKEFNFFNSNDVSSQLTLVKNCDIEKISLTYPSPKRINFTLTKTKPLVVKENLYGEWIAVTNRDLPPAPNAKDEKIESYGLTISQDTLIIHDLGYKQSHKWNLSNDGKRLYFIDEILKPNPLSSRTWKVVGLDKNNLTLIMNEGSGFEKGIVKLIKKDGK
jgi:hypothetical protein